MTTSPVTATTSLGSLTIGAAKAASLDNSKKVVIVWQKSTISAACKQALATITSGVHIWSPTIDGQKLDATAFATASYQVLILWAGDPTDKTAAESVHQWIANNRKYIQSTGMVLYIIPSKLFSLCGIESVYADLGQTVKALPKWAPNLHTLLVNFEAKFPPAEVSFLRGLLQKLAALVTKKSSTGS